MNFMECDVNYEDSQIVLFGAPFEGTVTNRKGTEYGPAHIREESYALETYSPYLDRDLEDIFVHDAGDLALLNYDTEATINTISEFVAKVLDDKKKPLMMGGEHLVSLPSILEAHKRFPDLRVIHFDAHTDLRDEYLGVKLSHSAVIYRVWETLGEQKIWQFGIRSGTRQEFRWAEIGHTNLTKFNFAGLGKLCEDLAASNTPVYLTIDLDVLDTSVFPGTGTPEPGGVTFSELLDAIKMLSKVNIVAADVVELAPTLDQSGTSTSVACKVLRELMLIL